MVTVHLTSVSAPSKLAGGSATMATCSSDIEDSMKDPRVQSILCYMMVSDTTVSALT